MIAKSETNEMLPCYSYKGNPLRWENEKWENPFKSKELEEYLLPFLWCQQLLSLNLPWIDHSRREKLKHVSKHGSRVPLMLLFSLYCPAQDGKPQPCRFKTSKWWHGNWSFLSLFGKGKLAFVFTYVYICDFYGSVGNAPSEFFWYFQHPPVIKIQSS